MAAAASPDGRFDRPAVWQLKRPNIACNNLLDAQFLRKPHFCFIENLFQAAEAGKGEAIDRKCAYFTDGGVRFERRAATFFMNQGQHEMLLWSHHEPMESLDMLRTAQSVITGDQVEFDRKSRRPRQ